MPNRPENTIAGRAAAAQVILGRWPRTRTRLSRFGISACCVAATLVAASGGPFAASAQSQTAATAPGAELAVLPDEADVFAASATVRKWIDALETPKMNDDASRLPLRGAMGVCIVLRRSGRMLGVGIDTAGDDLMLRRAAGRAVNEVFSDPALSSLTARIRQQSMENPESALTVDALRADLGRTLTIELEVAGAVMPLVGRSLEQLAQKIEPGLHGLAVRHDQTLELMFPAHLRVSNSGGDPTRLLLSASLKAGVPLDDLTELQGRNDLALYRFETLTLAQTAFDQPFFKTFRGDTIVAPQSVNRTSVAHVARGLARHLVASLWPDPPVIPAVEGDATAAQPTAPSREPLGIMGEYNIAADQYRPLIAPPLEQALAAIALARYAEFAQTAGDPAHEDVAAIASDAAQRILQDLALVAHGEADPRASLSACAGIVYAISEQPNAARDETVGLLFADAAARVIGSFDPASGFVDRASDEERARNVGPHAQAMLAGAMARLLSMQIVGAPAVDAAVVRQAIDAAWASTPQPQHVNLLPWIGWAEADFAAATNEPLAHVDELRLMIQLLERSRIGSESMPADQFAPDLLGGFALVSEDQSSPPTATAQSVRAAAWLCSVGADLIEQDKSADFLKSQLQTMRFLTQLVVRESCLSSVPNPVRAVGGIRAAAWNSTQPVPAQALALLTAVGLLERDWEHAEHQ